RKLVFSGEVSNPSEIENDDGMQRILSLCTENVVVDERDERIEHNERGREGERQPLWIDAHWPNDIGGKNRRGNEGVRPQQYPECDQQQRQCLDERAPSRGVLGGQKGKDGGDEPNDSKQTVAPHHPDEEKCWRRQRNERRRQRKPNRATPRQRSEGAKGDPIEAGRQQEHARRPGRDWIDQPPKHRHCGGLPIAKPPRRCVGIDIACIGGALAPLECQQREAESGCRHEQSAPPTPVLRRSLWRDYLFLLNSCHPSGSTAHRIKWSRGPRDYHPFAPGANREPP